MWFILLLIIIFVVYKLIKKSDNAGGASEKEIAKIVEAADNKDPAAIQKLNKYFDNGLTDERYNQIRRNVYMPKAEKGDANAQYWVGLLSSDKDEMISWMTKSAENGNTEAMRVLALGYSTPVGKPFGFGINKEKEEYWKLKAAETNPKAMINLALEYSIEGKKSNDSDMRTKAAKLFENAGAVSQGETRVKAFHLAGQTYADVPLNNAEKAYECYIKALSEKPCQFDREFDEEYAFAAHFFSLLLSSNTNNYQNNIKKAAYCAVVAAALNPENQDWNKDLQKFSGVYNKSEYEKWVNEARTYTFKLP